MAFTTTMLSWSVLEFGEYMGDDLDHAKSAIRWAADYLLKAAVHPGVLYVQVMPLFLLLFKHTIHATRSSDNNMLHILPDNAES